MVIVWLHRVLLHLYPKEYRARFGPEILATARAAARESRGRSWRALCDALASVRGVRADLKGARGMTRFGQDARFVVRRLRKDPRFTAFVVMTLAVAIGANVTLLGLADRLIFRGPEHIRDTSQVLRVYQHATPPGRAAVTTPGMGHVLFAAIQTHATTVVGAASYANTEGTLGLGAAARPIRVNHVSPEFFELLGVPPLAGRLLDTRDDAGAVVVGYPLWQSELGGDPKAIGKTLVVDGVTFTVVGIAPRGFTGAELGPVDVWVPIAPMNRRAAPQWETTWNAQWLKTIVRIAPGQSRERVGADLTSVLRASYAGSSAVMKSASILVAPLTASEAGTESVDVRIVKWLSVITALIFLIACANVMSLLLARGESRRREIAMCLALGASRSRLVRQLLVEAGALALAGAMAGVGFAVFLGGIARALLFESVSFSAPPISAGVAAWSVMVAAIATILTGLVPALGATRVTLTSALRGGGQGGTPPRQRLRSALTVMQAAVSVVLLIGAGLFIRSLWNARAIDLGIDGDQVLVVEPVRGNLSQLPTEAAREAERARRRSFLRDSLEDLRAIPGIVDASVAIGMPFGYRFSAPLLVPSLPGVDLSQSVGISAVADNYFQTIGTPVIEGRAFTAADRRGSAPVVIISAHMARQLWPGQSALGACIVIRPPDTPCAAIVGIAADTHQARLRESPTMHVYQPAGQEIGYGGAVLLVRPSGDPAQVEAGLKRRLVDLDPSITLVRTETLQARIDPQMRSWTAGATIFVFAGGLALCVAAAGLYSVMACVVAFRRQEIGIRLALGATGTHVAGVVLRASLLLAGVGTIIGVVAAAASSTVLEPLLFDVSPRDPLVFLIVGGTMTLVAIVASALPALRASRTDPLAALRD